MEQNGGLATLLHLNGFRVALVQAGVMRETRGNAMWGNHNALLVDLDGCRWLADAGIGDGFVDRSRKLSTSPESVYVTTLMAARPVAGQTALRLSRTMRRFGADADSTVRSTIADRAEFADTLATVFDVPLDDLGEDGLDKLWHKAGVQHDLWRTRE